MPKCSPHNEPCVTSQMVRFWSAFQMSQRRQSCWAGGECPDVFMSALSPGACSRDRCPPPSNWDISWCLLSAHTLQSRDTCFEACQPRRNHFRFRHDARNHADCVLGPAAGRPCGRASRPIAHDDDASSSGFDKTKVQRGTIEEISGSDHCRAHGPQLGALTGADAKF